MRKIDLKDLNNPPVILSSASAGRKLRKAIEEKDGNLFNGYHYRHAKVINLLKAYSLGKVVLEEVDDPKCYYCESSIEV